MIEKPRPELLTLTTTFYDATVSRNLFSKAEMRQFGASGTEGLNTNFTDKGKNFGLTNHDELYNPKNENKEYSTRMFFNLKRFLRQN